MNEIMNISLIMTLIYIDLDFATLIFSKCVPTFVHLLFCIKMCVTEQFY